MNRRKHDKHTEMKLDAELRDLDARLADEMPVEAPAGLADRIYAATAPRLGEGQSAASRGDRRDVAGRIGWTRRAGWRYAAAIGLLMFYLAAWARPHVVPTEIPAGEVALTGEAVAPPATPLDRNIDQLVAEVDELSASLHGRPAAPGDRAVAATATDSQTLAAELYELERTLENGGT